MKFALPVLMFCLFGLPHTGSAQELTVHFPHNSASLSESDGEIKLRALVETYRRNLNSVVWHLEGRASAVGSHTYNDSLSQRRVDAVGHFLRQRNVPPTNIHSSARGETLAQTEADAYEDRVVLVRVEVGKSGEKKQATVSTTATRVSVLSAVSRKPIAGNYRAGSDPVLAYSTEGITFDIPSKGSQTVTFSAPGYQDSTVTLLPSPNPQTVELLPEGVLEKLVFQNIYFYPNTPDIVPESFRALDQLLKQLKERPGVNIQIRGHVNWPEPNPVTPKLQEEMQLLSDQRAKAVMDWLIKKGIPAEHLSSVGLGFSQMLFPKANTEGQQAQNRRVEILLMK